MHHVSTSSTQHPAKIRAKSIEEIAAASGGAQRRGLAQILTPKQIDFFSQNRQSPMVVVDLDIVAENYLALQASMPRAKIFYALKANPAPEVARLLTTMGSSFDTASVPEIEACLAAGCPADRISYGNTIKKASDIARAYELGVRLYAFDSEVELAKIEAHAPGSRVFCRILTSGEGADWPLSKKFGCEPEMARDLMVTASKMNVIPYGISFHVGSQQSNLSQYDIAIGTSAGLFRDLATNHGIHLKLVNVGGGFGTRYRKDIPAVEEYGVAITNSFMKHFGDNIPEIIIEPGRGMVGNAGVIQTEVVLISKKSYKAQERSWVYLDVGKFGGLAETMDEAIQYSIVPENPVDESCPTQPVIIAGPTCDSADVLYEKSSYSLPSNVKVGDKLYILSTGAYTTSYSAVGFNGFAPLKAFCI